MMDVSKAIKECDFDKVYNRMNAYAHAKLKSVSIKDFDGIEPQDFVATVLEKALNNVRNWNSDEYTFEQFLFGSLKSDIDSFFKRKKKLVDSENFDIIPHSEAGYDEDLKNQIHTILYELGATEQEILLFNIWVEGIYKRKDIAQELELSEKEIDNIRKRLIRKLPHLRKMIKIS